MLARPITYIGAGNPHSRRTAGFIKVGQSRNPEQRAKSLSIHLLGTTSVPEMPIRQLLEPFAVPPEVVKARNIDGSYREWFYDTPAVRALAAWLCQNRPAESGGTDA